MSSGAPLHFSAESCGGGLDLLHVAVHLDASPGVADQAVGVDQKGASHHAHVFAPVVLLQSPSAISSGELFVRVREQLERKLVFGSKALMTGGAVRADADD